MKMKNENVHLICVSFSLYNVHNPVDARRWINVGLTLVHRRRRWTNVKPTLIKRLLSTGKQRPPLFTMNIYMYAEYIQISSGLWCWTNIAAATTFMVIWNPFGLNGLQTK